MLDVTCKHINKVILEVENEWSVLANEMWRGRVI